MSKFISILKGWLPFAATITLICGVIYVVMQQSYRHAANDFQLLMADDAASAISRGVDPRTMNLSVPADMGLSISPWVIVYDEKGEPLASGITLDGKIPKVPAGVLQNAKTKGTDLVTWEPRPGIRQALVVRRVDGNALYYVACGRSLSTTEERIGLLGKLLLVGWAVSMGVLLVVFVMINMFDGGSGKEV